MTLTAEAMAGELPGETGRDEPGGAGTRWGRSLVLAVPALLLTAFLAVGMTTGALATHVVIHGGTMNLATSGLYGVDFALTVVDNQRKVRNTDGTTGVQGIRLARVGFAQGKLNELCLAVHQSVLGVDYTIKVKGGDGNLATWEVDARNVELDGASITGNLTMDGVVKFGITGEDTTTIRNPDGSYVPNPLEADPAKHRFGVDATFAEFSKISGTVYDMEIVGPFSMPGLTVLVERGRTLCPAPPAPTADP